MARHRSTSPAAQGSLRLGVTGHRVPPKLPDDAVPAIRKTLDGLFAKLSHLSARPEGPALVVVSSLAEGADQIVAEEGLARGAALDVVLPFAPEEYARDFSVSSVRTRFRGILDRARHLEIIDGNRDDSPHAYEAAGLAMLASCNLLLAVWDESDADGRGGTAHVVADALKADIPVLLINPGQPERLMRIPAPSAQPEPADSWLDSFIETWSG